VLRRTFGGWLLILLLAVINGAFREAFIIPRTNEATGHAISSITLCAAILVVCWFVVGWMKPATAHEAWTIGALWLLLTLAFEFLAGHYLFGAPWRQLLSDYNIFRGRLWVLVLITTAVSPWLVAHNRGLLSS
jgi:hypothetical protein